MKKRGMYIFFLILLAAGCTTTADLEPENEKIKEDKYESQEEEQLENLQEEKEYLIQEEIKTQDIEDIVVFIEKPVYIPEEKSNSNVKPKLDAYDSIVDSLKKATQSPEEYKNGTFIYHYNEDFVYEIYCQPFHLTDIKLESGEVILGKPLLSEDETVWELTAGVSIDKDTGEQVQHLFLKPAYAKLDSTMIIITDRRVYHFRVKSYNTTHMAMVKFKYPGTKNVWAKKNDSRSVNTEMNGINPEFLSFDYRIKYSAFRKPEFLPQRVYDDGQNTYIQVNDIVLKKKLPIIFNEKNEIINYSVKKNIFVIPRLINKVTLRLGKEKVVVEKKITKIDENNNQSEVTDAEPQNNGV